MGTPTTSVGAYVAECQRVLASMADDGIRFELQYVETSSLTTAATARMSKARSRPCGARYSDATRLCTPWASNASPRIFDWAHGRTSTPSRPPGRKASRRMSASAKVYVVAWRASVSHARRPLPPHSDSGTLSCGGHCTSAVCASRRRMRPARSTCARRM